MSANLVFIQGTLHGVVYWANLYYVPLYLQNVRGYNPIMSGVIILPMVASHGVGSLVSGQIISRTGHYNPTIITSNLIWTVGAALQTIYTRTTPVWAICVIGFLQGIGIGGAFQREFSIGRKDRFETHLLTSNSRFGGAASSLKKSRPCCGQLPS
jgi:MFS family permease